MLPKVATTILHSTSRAAAAVQNQTHSAFRNVLNYQTSATSPGPSFFDQSSSWHQNGPSSGGKNTGSSRFQSGYYGASRAVTQANPVLAQDVTVWQTDESEDRRAFQPAPQQTRRRSSSISLASRPERVERFGVLKTVQLYARSRQLFEPPRPSLARAVSTSASADKPPLVRRNSTSSISSVASSRSVDPVLPLRPQSPTNSVLDPASPQTTFPPELSSEDKPAKKHTKDFAYLLAASETGDPNAVAEAVAQFRQTTTSPLVAEFNMALDALIKTRRQNEPLGLIMDTYNDLLQRGMLPNFRTYHHLLNAFLLRDVEVSETLRDHTDHVQWRLQEVGYEDSVVARHRQAIEQLQDEGNYKSAVAVFRAIVTLRKAEEISPALWSNMLRACSEHEDVKMANFVWSTFRHKTSHKADASMYRALVQLHGLGDDLAKAEEAFVDFRAASKSGSLIWKGKDPESHLSSQVLVWNAMIEAYFLYEQPEKAIGILDEMVKSCTSPGQAVVFDGTRAPPPASSTFTLIIQGFLNQRDGASAVKWFKRLLDEPFAPTGKPFVPLGHPTRPDFIAWRIAIEGLTNLGMIDEANSLVQLYQDRGITKTDGLVLRSVDLQDLFSANMARVGQMLDDLEANAEKAKEQLDFIVKYIMEGPARGSRIALVAQSYLALGHSQIAVNLLSNFIMSGLVRRSDGHKAEHLGHVRPVIQQAVVIRAAELSSLDEMVEMAHLASVAGISLEPGLSLPLLQAYQNEKAASVSHETISHRSWQLLLQHAVAVENLDENTAQSVVPGYSFGGTLSLLEDMNRLAPDFNFHALDELTSLVAKLVDAVVQRHGEAHVKEFSNSKLSEPLSRLLSNKLGSEAESPSDSSVSFSDVSTAPTSPMIDTARQTPRLVVDLKHSSKIDNFITQKVLSRSNPGPGIHEMMHMFNEGYAEGKLPAAFTIGRICVALGRTGDPAGAKRVYGIAQDLLANMEHDPKRQNSSWFQIEDAMIVALSQAGYIEDAHLHRQRIIDQGGAPSADAYGSLILFVRDTTDDTSNAMALYQESQMLGVLPNQYLYNNIISKLAKARKADHALELFHDMKARKINPSSVTYGALIGACSRVGDVESAERLFSEMCQERMFKPRVPPFNTMMQLYTTTKPNRARALHYWDEMIRVGVKPSPYSYKLLMEAYVLEPCDMDNVIKVFNEIVESPGVELQSTHFATLINAYGCVMKDLDSAIKVFESIPTFGRKAPAVDALIFEAMMNVLIAHRRTDLIPEWTAKLASAGVHMTAYIANVLIKGYAVAGDLESARELFESLKDPAQGVAARHNHAPHVASAAKPINPMEPVYREPSTWEAMVRAELGMGYRDRALDLLARLKERKYPEAVYNRISGIMVDHSMLPPLQ